MGTLWLYAIAIDDVRDIFGADEAEAAALRSVAAGRFGRPEPRQGLLGKLGPLFARPVDAPAFGPDTPTREDCDRLLAGHHVPPSRLAASWRLMAVWLEAGAWSAHTASLDEHTLDLVDFALGRSGVPAKSGVRALMAHDLGIALLAAPSMVAGYTPGSQAVAAAHAWRQALPGLEPEARAWLTGPSDWLSHFEEWSDAAGAGQRSPDLVCLWTVD